MNNNCAYVAANKVAASVCTKRFFFICEKNYTSVDLRLAEEKWSSPHPGATAFYLQHASKYRVFLTLVCLLSELHM